MFCKCLEVQKMCFLPRMSKSSGILNTFDEDAFSFFFIALEV